MSHVRCDRCNDPLQELAEMNDTEKKRQWLTALYPNSKTWSERVKNMPESQVIAIYLKKVSQPQRKAS